MTTKFDVGEMVHIRAVVSQIKVGSNGKPKYTIWVDRNHSCLSFPEEWLVKIEDESQPMSKETKEHYERLAAYYNGGRKNEPIQDTNRNDQS